MNTTETLAYIEEQIKEADGKKAKKLEILGKVIKEIADRKIRFYAETALTGGLRFFLAGRDQQTRIRIAVADGSKPEHPNGFERFNVTDGASECAFVIFAIEHSDNLITYIFRGYQIKDVKSLNLRFTDEAKRPITRKSKYDYALNNWNILK